MPTFEFDDGARITQSGADPSISFTDDGVNFTLSSAAGNAGDEDITNTPGLLGGVISVTDVSVASGGVTLTFNDGAGNAQFAGQMSVAFSTVFAGGNVTFVATDPADNVVVAMAVGTVSTGATTGNFTSIIFNGGFYGITSMTTAASALTCFLTGTQIATKDGMVNVEDIKAGDIITTVDGEAQVQWLGVQHVDTATAMPAKVNPICFTAGALAENVPSRDLYLSPNHAVAIEGRLFDAHTLLNGRSIYQVANPGKAFTYYHIETGAHELLLAENTPAETFVDFADRVNFDNGAERADAPMIPEMALPRVSAKRMVPTSVAQSLEERATQLSFALSKTRAA
ncbi:Hint domain-containing protein [Sulfitobacter guttiformis]|uniref:Hint domain-containing protein n=1 Tax=Sulfitobacter guttiformis TaxID=74349 RepID=A0A420DTH2_9RHOB|nr:Hint domain-containing protein [Sulfitobacter guttiformis]KIN74914.1 Hint 2 domain containing protein [Sulfitobacter guttiformis KCTC 32187]RKE97478.1 Hint domain-containing protein [Sulfitobacter guttiformis]